MNAQTVTVSDLLARYANVVQGHQFTRSEFLTWAAHHGLSRRTCPQVVQQAFDDLVAAGFLELVETTPGALIPAYRRAA